MSDNAPVEGHQNMPLPTVLRLWSVRLQMIATELEQGVLVPDRSETNVGCMYRTEDGRWHIDLEFEFQPSPAHVTQLALRSMMARGKA